MGTTDKKYPHSGHRQRVFEKVKNFGFQSFHDYELLEFVLFAAEPRKDTKETAKSLIKCFGSLKNVFDADRDALRAAGYTDRLISVLESYSEIVHRYIVEANSPGKYLDSYDKTKSYMQALNLGQKKENVYCAYLDASKKIIDVQKLFDGRNSDTPFYVDEITLQAIVKKAKYIVLGHNHPSGILTPSQQDLSQLKKLSDSLRIAGVFIFDSIISCDSGAYSCAESGVIKDNDINFSTDNYIEL